MSELTFHKLSWEDFAQDCIEMCPKLAGIKFDFIIAIARGGLIPARIIADMISTPISYITITTYEDFEQHREPVIADRPTIDLGGKTILIVDDVADSGKTFIHAIEFFKQYPDIKMYTAAPYVKSKTKYLPDFWTKKIDAWIIFPFDLKETADTFMKLFGGSKKAEEELQKVGFTQWEIDAVLEK